MSNYTLKDYLEGSPAKKKAIEEFYAAQKIALSEDEKLDSFRDSKEFETLRTAFDSIRKPIITKISISVRAYIGTFPDNRLQVHDYEWEDVNLQGRLEKDKKFKALSKKYKAFVVRVYAVAKKHGLNRDALLECIVN